MTCAVIRQLNFESRDFILVQIGGMFDGSPLLTEEMKALVLKLVPGADFIRSQKPPVLEAVLLGTESAGNKPSPYVCEN